jgi:hypothetical protein
MPTRRVGIIRAGNEPKASVRAITKRKRNPRRIMGTPKGAHMTDPTGVSHYNGLGALPSPYGPTLRGAHNALRASKNKNNMWPRSC